MVCRERERERVGEVRFGRGREGGKNDHRFEFRVSFANVNNLGRI